jgi:hypothetical protein
MTRRIDMRAASRQSDVTSAQEKFSSMPAIWVSMHKNLFFFVADAAAKQQECLSLARLSSQV